MNCKVYNIFDTDTPHFFELFERAMNLSLQCDERTLDATEIVSTNLDFFWKPTMAIISLNIIVCLSAVLGNTLIIVSILTSPNLRKPFYLLMTSMASVDLAVVICYQTLVIARNVFRLQNDSHHLCQVSHIATIIGYVVSSLSVQNSLLISIDRYLAIALTHRYKVYLNKRRVVMAILFVWILSAVSTPIMFGIQKVYYVWKYLSASLGFLYILATCIFYIKAVQTLHRHTSHVQAIQANPSVESFDVFKYRKSLNTMVIVLGWLVFCFTPYLLSMFYYVSSDISTHSILLLEGAVIGFCINSCTNPIIYLVRFSDLRDAFLKLLKI